MKKLLIAMSAAAMFSLCAKADTTPTLLGSMDFETGYSAGAPIATGSVDPSNLDPNPNQLVFWAGDNGESEIVEADNNKYLKVDTTAELTRKTAELTASENPVDPVSITNADVTVSAKVQFTAADEAPPVDTASGDKLIVWMRAAAEAEGTQGEEGYTPAVSAAVMVTDKTGVHVLTNIADEAVESFTAAWHTLAIKAVKAGTEQQPTAAFTVTLDGNDYGPFTSLVTGGDYCQTISSIGFKGTGAVDDIVFAKTAAVVVPDVTVTIKPPDGVKLMDAQGVPLASNLITTNAGATVKIYVDDADHTYSSVSSSVGTVGAYDDDVCGWPITYTTTAENTAVTMNITVTEGGKTPITDANVTLDPAEAVYTEGLQFPTVIVVVGGTTLTEDTHYTVTWNTDSITGAGDYTVTVEGIGDYSGNIPKTFTVTAPGSEKAKVGDTEYDSGDDFVAAATSGTVNTLPSGWTVVGNEVKNANGDTFATFPSFYNLTLANGTLTLELNNDALATAGTMVEVSVDTAFGLKVSASNAKLYYGLSSSATVNGTYVAPAKAGFTPGTGSALTLSAAKDGTARFYKLYVTDVLPNE